MIDAYIIEKLRKEREEQEQEWQPLQLPLENPDSTGDEKKKERPKHSDQGGRRVTILKY
jgi:hypothetical protein